MTIKKKQSRFNFWSGTASSIFGAAGATAEAVNVAKYLSALSGVSSAVRAEYNQDYFADVAAHIITKGINSRRDNILEKMKVASTKELDEYSLELAIADAVVYHGACSLTGGLEQADAAITKLNTNAGLDALGANLFFKEYLDAKAAAKAAASK